MSRSITNPVETAKLIKRMRDVLEEAGGDGEVSNLLADSANWLSDHQEERERSAIQGVAATILQGGAMKVTDEQRRFIYDVVAPEIYSQREAIFMHLFPWEEHRPTGG